jgi:hypothetical protein
LDGVGGLVRFTRRFGAPARLDAHERVWLVVDGVTDDVCVSLNAIELGKGCAFEVTDVLCPRNEVTLTATPPADVDRPFPETAMEIRCRAYLKDVRVTEGAVMGLVVGSADRPLDLYVIRERSTVGYVTITPTAAGTPFEFALEQGTSASLKVDLVDGGTVWYTWET